ncbi:MAG: GHKL domain-containing protein [Candidatus Marinimicrobia bacterium]|nr:GHKL domain-containing protein [FCB group bacterium]MBL7028247.1 GHKL domain-containing protein [Candidatus Neomarinimicrobiota bacterium]
MDDFKREVYEFLDYLPGALIEIDLSRRMIIYMNRMAFFLLGHSQSDVDTGIPLRDIFQNDHEYENALKVAKSFGLESYQTQTPYTRYKKQDLHDFMMRRKDGRGFVGECQGSFVLDQNQVPIGVRIYIRDLTEQRAMGELLHLLNELGNLISHISSKFINLPIEEIDKGINIALRDIGEFVDVDRSYVFLFTDNLTEMNNTHEWCSEGIEPQMDNLQDLPVEILPWWMEKLKNFENIHIPRVVDLPPEANSEKEILQDQDIQSLIVVPIIYAEALVGFLGFDSVRSEKTWPKEIISMVKIIGEIFINALKRKQAEKQVRDSDSLRELLLDIITHDLRNPVSSIYSFSDLAHTELPENTLINQIHLSSERLLKVLDNTTTLAQATFGERIPFEDLNLNDLVTEVADEFSSRLYEAEMDLRMDIPQSIIITANTLIREVFKNYISNAIKYARDGKKILIEAVVEHDSVLISVKDFANTIPEKNRINVYERGIQLSSDQKSSRGLGLAIVKRIAEAHDGEVWVEPNLPQGNSFCLLLPHKMG